VRVDYYSGERAQVGAAKIILEAFKPGTEPTGQQSVIQGIANYGQDAGYGSIIPLGTAGEGYQDQGGTMIIDSSGTYQQDPNGMIDPNNAPIIVQSPAVPGQPAQPTDQPAVGEQPAQPGLQGPTVGQQPAQPPVGGSPPPATDSSGGLY
jgi:penicillin-binding protein 1A